ncbi:MAG: P-loop NTPase [Bacteroidales bacterium]
MIETRPIKIAIASGKGGTGKTLVSTNMFHALQEEGYKCTLIDCDAEEPNDMVFFRGSVIKSTIVNQKVPVIDENKCTFCGKCHDYCNYNAIFFLPAVRIIKVIEDLCHDCGACLVACEYEAISEKDMPLGTIDRYQITENSTVIEARVKVGVFSPVTVIKAAIKEAANQEIVLLDSPPGTSCPFIQTVVVADYTILITEPTPFGLSDLKQSVETLKTMNKKYGVIINRSGLGDQEVYHYLEQENIPLLMEIPFNEVVALQYTKGELVAGGDPEWKARLVSLFVSIYKKYGNSSYQR